MQSVKEWDFMLPLSWWMPNKCRKLFSILLALHQYQTNVVHRASCLVAVVLFVGFFGWGFVFKLAHEDVATSFTSIGMLNISLFLLHIFFLLFHLPVTLL